MYNPSKQPLIMEDIQEKYNHLLQQNEALRQKTKKRNLLQLLALNKPTSRCREGWWYSPFTFPSVKLSSRGSCRHFHSLFKGRRRCFKGRWFSKTTKRVTNLSVSMNGGEAYATKKKYKCADCPNRHFAPLISRPLSSFWRARTRTVVNLSDCML